jgi:hypothetical protein
MTGIVDVGQRGIARHPNEAFWQREMKIPTVQIRWRECERGRDAEVAMPAIRANINYPF